MAKGKIEKVLRYLRHWNSEDDPRGNMIDVADRLEKELKELNNGIKRISDLGHNDDCIFCGLKDKQVNKLLEKENKPPFSFHDRLKYLH